MRAGATGTSRCVRCGMGEAVTLIFTGPPRFYVGRVQILGIKDERLTSLAEYGTQLQPGTAFTAASVPAGPSR